MGQHAKELAKLERSPEVESSQTLPQRYRAVGISSLSHLHSNETQDLQAKKPRATVPQECARIALPSEHTSVCVKSRLLGKALFLVKGCLPGNCNPHMPRHMHTNTFSCVYLSPCKGTCVTTYTCTHFRGSWRWLQLYTRSLEHLSRVSGCDSSGRSLSGLRSFH